MKLIKQLVYFLIGIFFLLSFFINPAFTLEKKEEYPILGKITTDNLNLRAGPNINYNSFLQLMKGDVIRVAGKKYGWYKIQLPSQVNCYVKAKYLKVYQDKAVSKVDNLNIRSGPGLNFGIVGQLNKREKVSVKSVKGEWVAIYPTKNSYGWVYSRYVKLLGPLQKIDNSLIKRSFTKYKKIERESSTEYKTIKEDKKSCYSEPKKININKTVDKEEKSPNKKKTPTSGKFTEAVGYVKDLGMIIYRPGAHKLVDMNGNILYYLKSQKYDLNNYIYGKVKITGKKEATPYYKIPTLLVKEIKYLKD